MFVAELDRPWLETPFVTQGFIIRDTEDVYYIGKYIEYAFVDIHYGGAEVFLSLPKAVASSVRLDIRLSMKTDFEAARLSFESATDSLERVLGSLKEDQRADITSVKQSIIPLIDSVFRNKEAVAALARLKESSDYRYDHGVSMAVWSAILGRHIGLHRKELEKLVVGCAMCDIGMTQLPKKLTSSAKPLTKKQKDIIAQHPIAGAEMIKLSSGDDFEIIALIENHHERYDGSGYPRGLEGAAIPLLARIAGLVDSYDAMIATRPHSKARTSFEAVQELLDCKDSLFQGALIEQFVQAIGLFPTGSLVELNTGEVAIVVKQNETRRLRPEVVVVLDNNKNRKSPLTLVDLSTDGIAEACSYWITTELAAGSYGIDSEEFFI